MDTEYELKRIAEAFHQHSSHSVDSRPSDFAASPSLEPIALVGLSGYLPGCMSVREFWQALDEERSLIEEIPAERFDWQQYYDPSGKDPHKMRSKWGGFIPDIAGFDPFFFKLLPTDAKQMDPRQRLLLMSVYQTLGDAGYSPETLKKSNTGVYVAHQDDEYLQISIERGLDKGEGYGQASQLANRIAYFFDFRGPSEIIDAQCAGAAVALHRAVSALRSGEISYAIVGAAHLLLRPQPFCALSRNQQLSRSNCVKSFQENADGHLRAEGVVTLMLKNLAQAEADGDFIYALLLNTAVNFNGQGGTSSASPNIESHVELIERCYRQAGIDPRTVSYIEAQGMGNQLSDLVEWEAFNRALRSLAKATDASLTPHSCQISTLKPMIGHMESTSALGALLKIVRSLQTDRIYRILDFSCPNPALAIDNQVCVLASDTVPWNKTKQPRLAGLHSFGMSGNNAHILIQEYCQPNKKRSANQASPELENGTYEFLIVLSSRGKQPLKAMARELYHFLATSPSPALKDIAYTLYRGREHMDYRMAMVVSNHKQLQQGLESYLALPDHISSTQTGQIQVFTGTVRSASSPETWRYDGLQAIALAWVHGSPIAWPEDPNACRVPLPAYPFEKQRYWLEEDTQQSSRFTGVTREIAEVSLLPSPTEGFVIDPDRSGEDNLRQYLREWLAKELDLPIDRIDEDRHLQDYGIDSLAGMRIIHSLSDTFDIEVLGRNLLQHPTIALLSKHLGQKIGRETLDPNLNQPEHKPKKQALGSYPLSEGQKGLWALQNSFPSMTAYNIPLCFRIRGIIDTFLLSKALKSVLKQHPVLTHILGEKEGVIRQEPSLKTDIGIHTEDVSGLDYQSILSKLSVKSKYPFDLEQAPLIRVDLLQNSQHETYILICVHHIVFDGSSCLPFIESLFDTYRQLLRGESPIAKPIVTTFQDFVIWERQMLDSGAWEKHRAYWRQALSGELPVIELPTDRPRSNVKLFSGAVLSTLVNSSLTDRIQRFSKAQRVNPSTLFLALFKILLHKYTGLDDITVGMPSMVRPQEQFRSVVGYFINMVAIRSKGFSQQVFATFLEDLKFRMSDSLDRAVVPFTTVVRDLGLLPNANASPVFQVAFEYQNGLTGNDLQRLYRRYHDLFDLEIILDVHQEGEYELVLEVFEQARGYRISLKYNPSLYEVTTIERMLSHYLKLVQVAVSNPNLLVHEYELMDRSEQQMVLSDWNATSVAYPLKPIHQLFQERVWQSPEAVAAICAGQRLSYEMLDNRSTILAKYLQQQGVQSETLVAVCVDRSVDMLVALLGVMKSGGAYVPLASELPAERLTFMLQDCDAQFLVTQSWLNDRIHFVNGQRINLDLQWEEIERMAESAHLLSCWTSLENLAYVIYTSGSTGKPKGVMIEHQALSNCLCAIADEFDIQSSDRLLAVTTYSFDIAALELFLPVIKGACCTICDREQLQDIEAIEAEIQRSKPTFMQATPSFWTMLLQSGWKNEQNLKILCGGETLNESLRSMFASIGCEVWNLYGPTETTIWSTIVKIRPGDSVTIGKPIANTRVYILDSHDQPAPIGVPGELCIAGRGLARGYWNQPQLTAQRFIDRPLEANNSSKLYRTGDLARWLPNGTLQHLGRLDLQVKIRGFRIELEEVEQELSHHPTIAECVVVAKERQDGHSLIGYYVARQSAASHRPQVSELVAYLKKRLPDYKIPTAFISLDRIPLTANGKVDRKSLTNREIVIQRTTEKVLAKTETQATLADIWKKVLKIGDISIDDGFFSAGGDSVLAVILCDRITRMFAREFSVTSLFKYSTIREIAAYLDDRQPEIPLQVPSPNPTRVPEFEAGFKSRQKTLQVQDSLAIVGISCHFPDASNHYQFWQNIREGKESGQFFCAEELRQAGVSEALIRNPLFVGVQRTIEGKGNFDPEFFNISRRNAVFMDPQFRLLLMHAWRAVEDAGYVSKEIPHTSVFISTSNSGYNTLIDQVGLIEATDEYTTWMLRQSGTIPTTISYQLGFTGPSLFVHTNCSSSLAGLSAAYQSLSMNQSDYALVGASTLLPKSEIGYLYRPGLNLSSDGHCRAFDANADGLVPGEGVAVLLVKKASLAIADGDRIYALIRGIGINNDGRDKAGFFAPSVRGQSTAIDLALTSSGIRADTISYVEAHGTGTKLGDPIEIQALCDSYRRHTDKKQYCALGSVKPNIGHLDTGAGLAGCIKVAMSLYYKEIPPCINFNRPNPAIDFDNSPFFIASQLHKWETGSSPRRAALSSFGIGGTNAHAILEEYQPSPRASIEELNAPVLIVLSARNDDRLQDYVESLVDYLELGIFKPNDGSEAQWLIDLAYTLQCGREPMNSRVAFVVTRVRKLIAKLRKFATQMQPFDGCYFGSSLAEDRTRDLFTDDEDAAGLLAFWLAKQKLAKLAQLWVQGLNIDWRPLYSDWVPSRIGAPTYPFAKEYYWPAQNSTLVRVSTSVPNPIKHPLLHKNISELSPQRYSTEFSGREFFLTDHQIRQGNDSPRKVLPAVVYLEMVHSAVQQRVSHLLQNPTDPNKDSKPAIALSNIAWVQPIFVDNSPVTVELSLFADENFDKGEAWDRLRFEIHSRLKGQQLLHCHGCAVVEFSDTPPTIDLSKLQDEIQDRQLLSADCYEIFHALGIEYGSAHRALDSLFLTSDEAPNQQVLAKLIIPDAVARDWSRYVLHPSLFDAALQSCIGLVLARPNSEDSMRLALPSSLERLEVYGSCAPTMWVWARRSPGIEPGEVVQRMDLDLCTDDGKVVARIEGLIAREIQHQGSAAQLESKSRAIDEVPVPPTLGPVTLKAVWDVVPSISKTNFSHDPRTAVFGANQTWKDYLAELGHRGVRVDSVEQQQSIEDFSRSLDLFGSIDRLLWIAPAMDNLALDEDRVIDAQETGVLQLFRLLKALFNCGYGKKSLAVTVVTTQSVIVRSDEIANPTTASIHGLVASLTREYPYWRVRLLDIDSGELPSLSELFPANSTDRFLLMARRDRQWFVRKLIPIVFEHTGEHNSFPAYKQKGVYVVIGGAGGVGEVWSRHVIEHYQAQVIWIGRREINEQIREQQVKLSKLGPKPIYIRADARNKEDLEKALHNIHQSQGSINGVVHSAIDLQDRSLAQMSIVCFRTGLLAKVETSVRLVQVFRQEPLDFVLFFSSSISFGQSPGQANYAAGCTFVDAYAEQLGKKWAASVKVINWGYWGSTGVVANAAYRERMLRNGIGSIEPQQAMMALDRLLQSQINQLAFVNLLKPQVLEQVVEDEVLAVVGVLNSQALDDTLDKTVDFKTQYFQQFQLARAQQTSAQVYARDTLLQKLLLANLIDLGVVDSTTAKSVVIPFYHPWLDESIRQLQQTGWLTCKAGILSVVAEVDRVEELWMMWKKASLDWEGSFSAMAEVTLVETCLRSLPNILTGRKLPQDVIFPESSLRLVEPLYQTNLVADFFNEVIAEAVIDAIASSPKGNKAIRILEVGAGTGGTTLRLLKKLVPQADRILEYYYTDISKAFLIHAQEHYTRDNPFLRVGRFDVEQPLAGQFVRLGGYDIVVATNVLHATKNIRQTLRNVKAAMAAGGQLFLNEIAQKSLFSHLTFGLLEGWWRFEDPEIRIPGCPALNSQAWKRVLQEEGFESIQFPVEFAHDLGHQIIIATSNGVIRQPLYGSGENNKSKVLVQIHDSSPKQSNNTLPLFSLKEKTTEFVCQTVSEATRTPVDKIRLDATFEQYGVDSILQVGLIRKLERVTGPLPITILFEYSTTRELVDYLLVRHQDYLTRSFGTLPDEQTTPVGWVPLAKPSTEDLPSTQQLHSVHQSKMLLDPVSDGQNTSLSRKDDIAIIGVAGRYPGAKNLDELWEVLRTGKSCITKADETRWPNSLCYQTTEIPVPSRFGGFLEDIYCFDRQLFGISAERAIAMPPEVRLFLEIAWETFEAAGYARTALKAFQSREKKGIGVFVGSMYSQYPWTHPSLQEAVLSSNGTEWQIPNQVSHFFDLTGPSIVLNTACSSSLTAIHFACESLLQGSCSMALAGGVNLTLDPSKFLSLRRSNFLGSGPLSKSFGDSDGMLPGEGVGAVLLKPLRLAIADNDRIEGVIKSSFVNHSGGRQAFTAPNPAQQTQLILDSLERSGIDVTTISYVESTANGSSLGDPIEIIALKNAFSTLTNQTGFCAIGSVKSNLGHLEAASGISQLTKVLLQFKYQTIVPTINATPRNPHIKLDGSPFYLQEQLSPWIPRLDFPQTENIPCRSLINSFGAGGSYANLIVEKYS